MTDKSLEPESPSSSPRDQKIVERDDLKTVRERLRAQKKTVVWTNGCFDLLHVGHIRSLQAAEAYGDVLFVGVNSDESVQKIKGKNRPLIPISERCEVLAALECVDYVMVFDETTPEAAIRLLEPDVHCKGADYAPPSGKPIPEAAVVECYGGEIRFLPIIEHHSTTDLIERIQAPS